MHGQSDDDGGPLGAAQFGDPYRQGRAARRGAAAWPRRIPQDELSTAAPSDRGDAPPDADALSDGIPSDYGPGHED